MPAKPQAPRVWLWASQTLLAFEGLIQGADSLFSQFPNPSQSLLPEPCPSCPWMIGNTLLALGCFFQPPFWCVFLWCILNHLMSLVRHPQWLVIVLQIQLGPWMIWPHGPLPSTSLTCPLSLTKEPPSTCALAFTQTACPLGSNPGAPWNITDHSPPGMPLQPKVRQQNAPRRYSHSRATRLQMFQRSHHPYFFFPIHEYTCIFSLYSFCCLFDTVGPFSLYFGGCGCPCVSVFSSLGDYRFLKGIDCVSYFQLSWHVVRMTIMILIFWFCFIAYKALPQILQRAHTNIWRMIEEAWKWRL